MIAHRVQQIGLIPISQGSISSKVLRRALGLCLPPLLMGILDGTLTLCGQSAEYWQGNYADANEAHPLYRVLLQFHPGVFVAAVLLVHSVLAGLILILPQTLALGTSITVATWSCFGASSWLWVFGVGGIRYRVALFALSGFMLAVGIRWGWQAQPAGDVSLLAGLPWPVGWLVILVLCTIFSLLFFSRI